MTDPARLARSIAPWLLCASALTACGAPVVRPDGSLVRDATVDVSGPCPAGASMCGEVCVDTTNDRANCGACGVTCGFGVPCQDGRCDDGNCPAGQVRCGDRCFDPRTSEDNCGGCNNPCDRGVACVAGRCDPGTCVAGFERCGADCAQLSQDIRHCGACGAACAAGQACMDSMCVRFSCREGLTQCGSTCTDPRFDPENCGSCGHRCSSSQRCSSGRCEDVPCTGAGMSRCHLACVDLLNDPANCGRCDVRCASGRCSAGMCVQDVLRPQWVVSFETPGEDAVYGVSIDPAGNVYVAGSFSGSMRLSASTTLETRGQADAFIASYTRTGTLRWARSVGGLGSDEALAINATADGRLYVGGYFTGQIVTATRGTITGAGQLDPFLLSLDPATGNERAVLTMGGIGFDVFTSIAYRNGRLVVGGRFSESMRVGTTDLTAAGRLDGLVFAADPTTLAPIWGRAFGSVNDDHINAVLLDNAGRVYFGGSMTVSVTWGRSSLLSAGQADGVVGSLDSVGTPQWAVRFGGAEEDSVNALEYDGTGSILAAGYFRGTAEYPGGTTIAARGSDVIVLPVTPEGVAGMPRIWGSLNDDGAYGIARGPDGRWLITGQIKSNIDFGLGPIATYRLSADAFMAGFDSAWRPMSVPTVQGADNDVGTAVAAAPDNAAAWGGRYTFGGNLGLGFVPGAGGTDGFLVYVSP